MMYNIFVIIMKNEKNKVKIDIIIKIISFILLVAWMILVFWFSSQVGDESSSTSGNTIRRIVTFFNSDISSYDLENIVNTFQPITRKIAHLTLYTMGGFLIYNFIYRFRFNKNKKIVLSLIIGVLYAMTDEIHQYFVPGRSSKVFDVLIDSTGIILGIIIFILLLKIISVIKNKIFVKKGN